MTHIGTGRATTARSQRPVAVVLTSAFILAAAVTAGLTATGRLPAGLTGHDPLVWAFHLVGFGTAALALIDRTWARLVVAAVTAGYVVAALELYAVLFVPGLLAAVGWFANDVYLGLLLLAEALCVRRLLGAPGC